MDNTTAKVSCFARAYHLSGCGFVVTERIGAEDMTEHFFAEYNKNTPEHPMAASAGVDYVFAVRA